MKSNWRTAIKVQMSNRKFKMNRFRTRKMVRMKSRPPWMMKEMMMMAIIKMERDRNRMMFRRRNLNKTSKSRKSSRKKSRKLSLKVSKERLLKRK